MLTNALSLDSKWELPVNKIKINTEIVRHVFKRKVNVPLAVG